LGLGLDADARGDGLKSIREGLVSIILRIVSPLVADIRAELTPVIKALEGVNDSQTKATAGAKTSTVHHPSIVTLRTVMPVYTKALARYTAFSTAHAVLAAFLVGMVWKGLVALSNRPFIPSAPPSPVLASNKKVRTPPPYSTPPLTPQLGRFTLKLPPSRPPSPPIPAVPASASADAQALFEQLNLLPRPSADKEATRLAREAVDEAFDALKALSVLLDAIHKTGEGRTPEDMAKEIHELAKGIPLLVALPVLLHAYGGLNSSSVAKLLDLSGTEYRRSCLSGIGRAEESAHVIAQSVMDALEAQGETNGIVYQWLLIESSTST
jgi:cation transporter-like permease